MILVTLMDTEAKGRNGWFRSTSAEVFQAENLVVHVDIRADRSGWNAPCRMELSPRDAKALAYALLAEAREKK